MTIKLNGVRVRPAVVVPPPEPAPPTTQLIGWWRADDIAQAEGSSVTSWKDRSGECGAILQAPSMSAPTLNLSVPGFNNKPAVDFNGSAQLRRAQLPNYPVGNGEFSLYVVHDPTLVGSIRPIFGWGRNNATQQRMCMTLFDAGMNWIVVGEGYAAATKSYAVTGDPQIASIFHASGTNMGDDEIWIDGVPGGDGSGSALPWNIPDPCNEVCMGGLPEERAVAYVGKIAEVLVYKKYHTLTERAETLSYLSSRYGISVA